MRYCIFVVALVGLVSIGGCSQKISNKENEFTFSSQENPSKWVVYDWPELESNIGKFSWDSGILSIDCKSGKTQYGLASWLRNDIPRGSVLHCQVEIKTQGNISAAVGVAYHQNHQTDQKSRQGFISSTDYHADNWRTIEWKTTVQSAPSMALVIYAEGQGQVWFRSLRVEIFPEATPTAESPNNVSGSKIAWEAEPQDVVANESLYGKQVFHAIEGVALPVIFRYRGDASALTSPSLLIELPKGLEVVGSRCNHFKIFTAERITLVNATDSGSQIYRVDQLGAMDILKPNWAWRRSSAIFILAGKPFDRPATLRYAVCDGDNQSPWKSFEIDVLPPLQPLPDGPVVSIIPWHQKDIALPGNDSLLENLLITYERAGINVAQIVRGDVPQCNARDFEQQLIQRGWTGFMPISDPLHDPFREIDSLKLERMQTIDGEELDVPCPSYVLQTREIQEAYCKSLEKQIQAFQSAAAPGKRPWVALDLELWGKKQVEKACFDDRCRITFAQQLGLSDTPTAKEIINRYQSQWAVFRQNQTDQISKIVADYVHKNHPTIGVAYYDYPIPTSADDEEEFLSQYPADTRKYDDDLDLHLLSLYRPTKTEFFDLLAYATDQLKKPVVPVTFVNNSSVAYSQHSPRDVYMETMAAGLLGAPALSVWTGEGIDGAYLTAMNQAQNELAKWSSSIKHGKWVKSGQIVKPSQAEARCIILQSKDETVLAILNYGSKSILSGEVSWQDSTGAGGNQTRMANFADVNPQSVLVVVIQK